MNVHAFTLDGTATRSEHAKWLSAVMQKVDSQLKSNRNERTKFSYENQLTRTDACATDSRCNPEVNVEPSHFESSLMRLVESRAAIEAL